MAVDRDALVKGLLGRSAPMSLQELVAANQQRNPLVGMMAPVPNAAQAGAQRPPENTFDADMAALLGRGRNAPTMVSPQAPPVARPAQPAAAATPAAVPRPDASSPIQQQIRSAFHSIAGTPPRDGVRLHDLRARLSHIDRADLDKTLLEMRNSGTANLMNLDNPRDINAVGDAALKNDRGQSFHVLWM